MQRGAEMSERPQVSESQTTNPYALGFAAGEAYCNAAANDGMGDNPFSPSLDADRWQEGFNHAVEIGEESN